MSSHARSSQACSVIRSSTRRSIAVSSSRCAVCKSSGMTAPRCCALKNSKRYATFGPTPSRPQLFPKPLLLREKQALTGLSENFHRVENEEELRSGGVILPNLRALLFVFGSKFGDQEIGSPDNQEASLLPKHPRLLQAV